MQEPFFLASCVPDSASWIPGFQIVLAPKKNAGRRLGHPAFVSICSKD
jgi:hypothetical protein